ncbi:MAG: hypothetical protein HY079_11110 [Elusimicrobia bacterium]|nr:hypothetical protein [Elusimicrobiota bacterium]
MSVDPDFDRWVALAFASQFLVVFLAYVRAGMRPSWATFRPTIVGFVLAGLLMFRGVRYGAVEVGSLVIAALFLGNLAYRVSTVRGAAWESLDWHARWVLLAPAAMLVVLLVSSVLMDLLPRPASTRVLEGMSLFMIAAAVVAFVDPKGPTDQGLGWREYGTALVPLGTIGLIATDDKRADAAFLGAAGLGLCFLSDVLIRGRTYREKRDLSPLGLELTHDGLWLNGAADGVRLRFKDMRSYWDLEMEADVAPGPFLAAMNAAIPLEVPLRAFLPGHVEIPAPPAWDGYRVFTGDAAAARAALADAPAPRPVPRYLRRRDGVLFVHWEVPADAAPVPAQFRLRLRAVAALARRWKR